VSKKEAGEGEAGCWGSGNAVAVLLGAEELEDELNSRTKVSNLRKDGTS